MSLFSNISLKAKLLLTFGVLAMGLLLLGILGNRSVNSLVNQIEYLGDVETTGLERALRIETLTNQVALEMKTILNPEITFAQRQQAKDRIADIRVVYGQLVKEFDEAIIHEDERITFDKFSAEIKNWAGANNRLMELNKELEALGISNPIEMVAQVEGFIGDHHKGITTALKHVDENKPYDGGTDHTACRYGNWLLTTSQENPAIRQVVESTTQRHKEYHSAIKDIQASLLDGDQESARKLLSEELVPAAEAVIGNFNLILNEAEKASEIYREMVTINEEDVSRYSTATLGYIAELAEDRRGDIHDAIESSNLSGKRTASVFLVFSGLALLGTVAIGYFFGDSISKKLALISERISDASADTQSGANQVAQSSSSLAEGASSQAASLEETSSSMEEMTSMISRDAELANTTANKALDADKGAKDGVKSMDQLRASVDSAADSATELSSAMQSIKDSSDGISKIIKTIDEIAFQTNILALNAAVEAARAGEAGAGFAVVADEVRSLAQRAADAARETQTLIEDSVQRSERGVSVNQNLTEKLGDVMHQAEIVDDQLKGIAEAISTVDNSMNELKSSVAEQQDGVNQINATIAQVNDITQTNASSAEETASASEELNAQANGMLEIVSELNTIVHGMQTSSKQGEESYFSGESKMGANMEHAETGMKSDSSLTSRKSSSSGFSLPDDLS